MAFLIDELLGSGDFDAGFDGGNAQVSFFTLEAASHEEAVSAAFADPRAPVSVNGYLRSNVKVEHKGAGHYYVLFQYRRGVPSEAGGGASPGGQQTPGMDPNTGVSRDVSFSTGSATKKKFVSIETVHALAAGGVAAPDFGGLIGVDIDGGKVEGCEVFAPTSDVTIQKRFAVLTVGWFRYMLSAVATTNAEPYLGMDTGEWLFAGCDGQFKDDDTSGFPWTVTGRLKFSPNKDAAGDPELTFDGVDGEIVIPYVDGWHYVWVMYQKVKQEVTIGGAAQKFIVSKPKFVYVEQVYPESDFGPLSLG